MPAVFTNLHSMSDQLIEQGFDRENAFLIYATFAGDIVRTAHALNLGEGVVLRMAEEEGWMSKLGPIIALKKSTRPGDLERACNRALNFAQAHRMRLFVGRVIHRVCGMSTEEFENYIMTSETKKGRGDEPDIVTKKLSTRALADLASAMEKAHALSYMSLNDTAQERVKRKESEDADVSVTDIHAAISEGFAKVRASNTPRAQLFDAQLEQAQQIVKETRKPANPNDNDDH